MGRQKKHAAHENHERWLVSYADFITLLFAFFVVMYASSQADKTRAARVAESVRKALEDGHAVAKVAALLGGTVDDAGQGNAMMKGPGGTKKGSEQEISKPYQEGGAGQPAELLPSLEYLNEQLKEEIRSGKVQISLEQRGLVVSLQQAAFFPSGEDTIAPSTYPSIEKLAAVIRRIPKPVRLEGHTDNVPIHNSRFRSNWELSAARSIAMLELLSARFEIPRDRLAVAGYAENVPVESNESEKGRARNRRVDIVILNKTGLLQEPAPTPGAEPARVGEAGTHATAH